MSIVGPDYSYSIWPPVITPELTQTPTQPNPTKPDIHNTQNPDQPTNQQLNCHRSIKGSTNNVLPGRTKGRGVSRTPKSPAPGLLPHPSPPRTLRTAPAPKGLRGRASEKPATAYTGLRPPRERRWLRWRRQRRHRTCRPERTPANESDQRTQHITHGGGFRKIVFFFAS